MGILPEVFRSPIKKQKKKKEGRNVIVPSKRKKKAEKRLRSDSPLTEGHLLFGSRDNISKKDCNWKGVVICIDVKHLAAYLGEKG